MQSSVAIFIGHLVFEWPWCHSFLQFITGLNMVHGTVSLLSLLCSYFGLYLSEIFSKIVSSSH